MSKQPERKAEIDAAALKRYGQLDVDLEARQQEIASGRFNIPKTEEDDFRKREAEQDRLDRAQRRRATKTSAGFERQMGAIREILSIEFLEAGQDAARAIGRIEIAGGIIHGTAVLIGGNVLLTNHHVLESEQDAEDAELDLDYEENRWGPPKQTQRYSLAPHRFFYTNKDLDVTLVAVASDHRAAKSIEDFGWHPLIEQQGKIRVGDPVNIIHHPLGFIKSITLHNSNFLHVEEEGKRSDFLWYSSDTEPGSSGAPVFNNRWEIVALHHAAVAKKTPDGNYATADGGSMSELELKAHPERAVWIANEGIRASRIVRALKGAKDSDFRDPSHHAICRELLDLWQRANEGEISREPKTTQDSGAEARRSPMVAETPVSIDRKAEHVDKRRGSIRIEIDLD